jgi:formamidopyrimidine-DNA glycosylase
VPELPEVETTRLGIAPHLLGRSISEVVVRQGRLRWPIPNILLRKLPGQRIETIARRAKYLLVNTRAGSAVLHLGMSGSLRVLDAHTPVGKHDHYDWHLDSGRLLRYTDPRRFGCLLWQAAGHTHPLLAGLGPEPLDEAFDGDHLWQYSRGRAASVKTFIMDQAIVVGVGNIYAAEALFAAGIHPRRKAGSVSRERYQRLAEAIKGILGHAIQRGGTTLRDFISPDGVPGYFEQELFVYGRAGEPCRNCAGAIRSITLGQRSSFYCAQCQH